MIIRIRRALPVLLCLGAAYSQESSPPNFHSHVNLVVVNAQVYDPRSGKFLRDLTKADFEVLDDGHPQTLQTAELDGASLDIVLLLDISGSIIQSTRQLAHGANSALDALKYDDRMAVMSFSSKAHLECAWSANRGDLAAAIARAVGSVTRVDAGTRLYDAVARAIDLFESTDQWRSLTVVAVTDDQEHSSRVLLEELVERSLARNVTVNGVILEPGRGENRQIGRIGVPIPGVPPIVQDRTWPANHRPSGSIRSLVEESGGEYWYPVNNRDALTEMFDHLRGRYLLAYTLPEGSAHEGTHRISIRLTEPAKERHLGALIRSRASYTF